MASGNHKSTYTFYKSAEFASCWRYFLISDSSIDLSSRGISLNSELKDRHVVGSRSRAYTASEVQMASNWNWNMPENGNKNETTMPQTQDVESLKIMLDSYVISCARLLLRSS